MAETFARAKNSFSPSSQQQTQCPNGPPRLPSPFTPCLDQSHCVKQPVTTSKPLHTSTREAPRQRNYLTTPTIPRVLHLTVGKGEYFVTVQDPNIDAGSKNCAASAPARAYQQQEGHRPYMYMKVNAIDSDSQAGRNINIY